MQLHRTLLLAVFLATTVFGQTGAPAQADTLQALLMEVRQLRQTLVVTQRLALQYQHVQVLSRQLDQLSEQIAQSAQESKPLMAAVAANEARLAKEQQNGSVRHDIEDEIKKIKEVLEEKSVRDQQRQAKESQLVLQLQAEQTKLNELNDRLDTLERSTQPVANK